jgi:hypothetical protein
MDLPGLVLQHVHHPEPERRRHEPTAETRGEHSARTIPEVDRTVVR